MLLLLLFCGMLGGQVFAWRMVNERAPQPVQEFRAAWVASVYNLDWPSRAGLSAAAQQKELIDILNKAAQMRLNAIILQVRPNSDALYRSSKEPWSVWLSGAGVNPGYDPLAFAVAEAHKRGIEVHAWFNPFRCTISGKAVGRGHVSQTLSKHVLRAGTTTMLNPASSTVRDHVLDVILDVVKRYNIDGVHLDDYFYPYPPNHNVADGKSPAQRRDYINDFVEELYDEIKDVKPWVRVGISPFGIWQPGYPKGVKAGVNAYHHLACDAVTWLRKGWVDYLSPQLYWRIAGDQSYTSLMQWWSAINPQRPIWPGIASVRINSDTDPGRPASEIGRQVDYSRSLARQSAGQLFWSWTSLKQNRGGVQRELAARYSSCAIPPAMPWLSSKRPARPLSASASTQGNYMRIAWQAADKTARKWVIQARFGNQWRGICILPGGQSRVALPVKMLAGANRIAVCPVTAYGMAGESAVLAP